MNNRLMVQFLKKEKKHIEGYLLCEPFLLLQSASFVSI
jgi:hypothetical protein